MKSILLFQWYKINTTEYHLTILCVEVVLCIYLVYKTCGIFQFPLLFSLQFFLHTILNWGNELFTLSLEKMIRALKL